MESIVSILKSKWFWIILAVIIALIIINKHWDSIKQTLFERKITNYTTDSSGKVIEVSQLDEQRLQRLADKIRSEASSWYGLDASDLEPVLELSDQELEQLAKYYKKAYSISLYQDIDNELMPFTQADEQLMTRLDRLALK